MKIDGVAHESRAEVNVRPRRSPRRRSRPRTPPNARHAVLERHCGSLGESTDHHPLWIDRAISPQLIQHLVEEIRNRWKVGGSLTQGRMTFQLRPRGSAPIFSSHGALGIANMRLPSSSIGASRTKSCMLAPKPCSRVISYRGAESSSSGSRRVYERTRSSMTCDRIRCPPPQSRFQLEARCLRGAITIPDKPRPTPTAERKPDRICPSGSKGHIPHESCLTWW